MEGDGIFSLIQTFVMLQNRMTLKYYCIFLVGKEQNLFYFVKNVTFTIDIYYGGVRTHPFPPKTSKNHNGQ